MDRISGIKWPEFPKPTPSQQGNYSVKTLDPIIQAVAANLSAPTTVDLQEQVIERAGIKTIAFRMNPRLRSNLLLGVDDLDAIVKSPEVREELPGRGPQATTLNVRNGTGSDRR